VASRLRCSIDWEREERGSKEIEIVRVKITEAGRRAL